MAVRGYFRYIADDDTMEIADALISSQEKELGNCLQIKTRY